MVCVHVRRRHVPKDAVRLPCPQNLSASALHTHIKNKLDTKETASIGSHCGLHPIVPSFPALKTVFGL